mmetsp:Transcript_1611/g.4426  ORF Transcript_1611/g.4426 Transcript_1611/m.4426 type:complete len:235 (-) Transcript_1611:125-829(-)
MQLPQRRAVLDARAQHIAHAQHPVQIGRCERLGGHGAAAELRACHVSITCERARGDEAPLHRIGRGGQDRLALRHSSECSGLRQRGRLGQLVASKPVAHRRVHLAALQAFDLGSKERGHLLRVWLLAGTYPQIGGSVRHHERVGVQAVHRATGCCCRARLAAPDQLQEGLPRADPGREAVSCAVTAPWQYRCRHGSVRADHRQQDWHVGASVVGSLDELGGRHLLLSGPMSDLQ